MAPTKVPLIVVGMDARLALAETRSALLDANGRLSCSSDWYAGVRKNYAK
jgi:hypothetical protein